MLRDEIGVARAVPFILLLTKLAIATPVCGASSVKYGEHVDENSFYGVCCQNHRGVHRGPSE